MAVVPELPVIDCYRGLVFSSLVVSLAGMVLFFWPKRLTVIPLLFVGFGIFLVFGSSISYHNRLMERWLKDQRVNLEGVWDPPNTLTVSRINGEPIETRLYVSPKFSHRRLNQYRHDGRVHLNATGLIQWPDSERFVSFLRREDQRGFFKVDRIHTVEVLEHRDYWYLQSLRRWIKRQLHEMQPRAPTSVTLIKALLLGEKDFSSRIKVPLRRLGIYHLFVISGLHIGVLFYGLYWLTRTLSDYFSGFVIAVALVGYVTFLQWPLSATRALVMVGLGGLSTFLHRRATLLSIASATVLVFMVFDPFVIFEVGFQLSIGAVMGIIAVRPWVEVVPAGWGLKLLLIATGAYAGVLPVILYHFHYVTPVALVGGAAGSLIFSPLVAVLGLQLIFLSVDWTFVHQFIEGVLATALSLIGSFLNTYPLILEIPTVSIAGAVLIGVLLLFCLRKRTGWSIRLSSLVIIGVVLWFGSIVNRRPTIAVKTVSGKPYVLLRTEHGQEGLYFPPATRLDKYSFDSTVQSLQSMGINHLDVLISDYSRRMVRRFDPSFTIRRVSTHWGSESGYDLFNGSFRVEGSKLKTDSFSIDFEVTLDNGPPIRSNGLAAITSNDHCLVTDSKLLRPETFKQLRRAACEIHFLKDSPAWFSVSGQRLNHDDQISKTLFVRLFQKVKNSLTGR
ncbi:MAG: ComEC/Rec2 family competence protein [bacterium]